MLKVGRTYTWDGKRAGNPPVAVVLEARITVVHPPHRPKGATPANWFALAAGSQYERHEQALISFVGIA